jgi:hypothetical protein
MNSHRLVIDRDLVQRDYDSTSSYASDDASKYQLMYQLTRITRDKGALAQGDRLDALAMGVAYFAAHNGYLRGQGRRPQPGPSP